MEEKLYFAYGSNINLDQMTVRCPAAQVVGPVVLEGYELLFRGNSGRNGVATIASKEGSQVHGLLWKITPECERALDRYEGYPHLYGKEPVTVRCKEGSEVTVMAYVMTGGEWWREPAIPSEAYYKGIQEGFLQHGLPLASLKKAWEHTVAEIHEMTERVNDRFLSESSASVKKKGKDRYER